MVQIRFKAQGANSIIGGFSHGDTARVSDAFAKHLVEEAGVAEYIKADEHATAPTKTRKAKVSK